MKLNPRQEQFCCEYAKSGNAGASYQKVYGNTSEASAAVQGHRLLKNPNVQARLKEIQDELASEKIMDAKEIQERLTAIGRGQVTEEIITSDGQRIKKQAAIRDMLKATEILSRIQGLFVSRAEVDVRANTPIVIAGGDCLPD